MIRLPVVNYGFSLITDVYLKLEDVTHKFNKPCIMDVKIGRKSYDPFASSEKIQQQVSKYPLMEEIGFLVLGMRVRGAWVRCVRSPYTPLVRWMAGAASVLVEKNEGPVLVGPSMRPVSYEGQDFYLSLTGLWFMTTGPDT